MTPNNVKENLFSLADLVIRQVERKDLTDLEWDGEYWKFRGMFTQLFRQSLAGQALMWVVVSPSDALIGQAFVMLKSGEPDAADGKNRAYVFSFRVKEKWRNRGIGSYLMKFIEDDLKQRGFKFVTLNVAKENQNALRLYQRLGYAIIGSQPGIWSYKDPKGVVHHVNEPSWRMIKTLVQKMR